MKIKKLWIDYRVFRGARRLIHSEGMLFLPILSALGQNNKVKLHITYKNKLKIIHKILKEKIWVDKISETDSNLKYNLIDLQMENMQERKHIFRYLETWS